MKIQRKYARLCIVSITVGLILLIFGSCFENLIGLYISPVFIAISFIIKFFILKCPYCGWGGAVPQWSKSGTIHCPKCGHVIEYSDR